MKTNSKVTACLATALILAFALPAQSATITVNSAADDIPPFTNDGNCTLREAITNANFGSTFADCAVGDAGLDEIVFDAALAGATITLDGTQLQPITEALSITGPVSGDSAGITLDGDNTSRILVAEGLSPGAFPVLLDSLTLTRGRTTAANESGGAIRVSNANISLEHVRLVDNATEGNSARGGGLAIDFGGLTLNNSDISGNSTSGMSAPGGGIMLFDASLSASNSTISNNSTTDAPPGAGTDGSCGGGIAAFLSPLDLLDSTVSENRTTGDNSFGGGLCTIDGDLFMARSHVIGNSTQGNAANGGGLALMDADLVQMTDSTVTGNETAGMESPGGGIYVAGDASISNSEISANVTHGDQATGGGLALDLDSANGVHSLNLRSSTVADNSTNGAGAGSGGLSVLGNAVVTNSTISGNAVNGVSGAVGGLGVALDTTLTHSSVVDNVSADGVGGIIAAASGGTFTLNNSLVVQSGAANLACNTIASGVNNLATDASCGDEPNNADGSGVTVASAANINLAPLAFNGGPSRTHALNAGSVAIDAAPFFAPCSAPFPTGAGAVDQRGVPRPQSAQCDIGAYEVATEFDMGDAPAPYPTLLADNGAAHTPIPGSPILGAQVDFESDGQPTADADGDDLSNTDDEDGVVFTSTPLVPGADATVDITVLNGHGPALLNAWVDFNADGDWNDAGEQIFTDEPVVDGSNTGLSFPVPPEIVSGDTFARFRLSSAGSLAPTGMAIDGEVEDHKVAIVPPAVMFNARRNNPVVREKAGMFTITGAVILSNPSNQTVTVDIVFDAGASQAAIPADFDFSPTTVSFAPGETSADVAISIVDDGVAEGEEIAAFNLANPVNATLGVPDSFQARLRDPGTGGDDDDDGGCSLSQPGGSVDPLLPLILLLAVAWVTRAAAQRKTQ